MGREASPATRPMSSPDVLSSAALYLGAHEQRTPGHGRARHGRASSGIGEATARALAAHGATVAVAARRKDRLDALAARDRRARDRGRRHRPRAGRGRRRAHRAASSAGSTPSINNAGVMLLGPIVDAPVEEWDRMIDLNLKGLLYVAHAALPHLLRAAESEPRAGRGPRQRQLGRGPPRRRRRRHLPADQARRRRRSARRCARRSPTATCARRWSSRARPRPSWSRTCARRSAAQLHARRRARCLKAEDIADAIVYIVTRPRHVAVNEMLIRPTEQVR